MVPGVFGGRGYTPIPSPPAKADINTRFHYLGAFSGVEIPDPIPNSVVKHSSADGSSSEQE